MLFRSSPINSRSPSRHRRQYHHLRFPDNTLTTIAGALPANPASSSPAGHTPSPLRLRASLTTPISKLLADFRYLSSFSLIRPFSPLSVFLVVGPLSPRARHFTLCHIWIVQYTSLAGSWTGGCIAEPRDEELREGMACLVLGSWGNIDVTGNGSCPVLGGGTACWGVTSLFEQRDPGSMLC